MKKRICNPLQEILAQDITIVQDYIEDAFGMFMGQFLDTSSGVIYAAWPSLLAASPPSI
jgi:protein associated with RNAse G/E